MHALFVVFVVLALVYLGWLILIPFVFFGVWSVVTDRFYTHAERTRYERLKQWETHK